MPGRRGSVQPLCPVSVPSDSKKLFPEKGGAVIMEEKKKRVEDKIETSARLKGRLKEKEGKIQSR